VHASGVPFSDRSGDRLRQWMGVDAKEFYDTSRIVIVPMGFCYPGADAKGGDLPPRRECAKLWRARVLAELPQLEVLLLIGGYAQRWHLGDAAKTTLTDTVRDWRRILARPGTPRCWPLPHPSWRNNHWLDANPWFTAELLPNLRIEVRKFLSNDEQVSGRKKYYKLA